MTDRAAEIAGFLAQTGWDQARQKPLQADFSARRFARLERKEPPPLRAILMDADPDQKTKSYIEIAGLLRGFDISAPAIYAANPEAGLVLMEDFGHFNFGKMLDAGDETVPLLRRAADVLVHLHKVFDKTLVKNVDLPIFGGALFAAQVELFLDAYFPFVKERETTHEESESFRAAWKTALRCVETLPQTLMLRDFMPDNLMSLPAHYDWRSTGVLDFQDAGLGPIAYDIASLCEIVRRDLDYGTLEAMIDYYFERAAPDLSKPELASACRVLAAQRHMRILGIVVRIAVRNGRREKLAYIPRIWGYLDYLLENSELKSVREWVENNFDHSRD